MGLQNSRGGLAPFDPPEATPMSIGVLYLPPDRRDDRTLINEHMRFYGIYFFSSRSSIRRL